MPHGNEEVAALVVFIMWQSRTNLDERDKCLCSSFSCKKNKKMSC